MAGTEGEISASLASVRPEHRIQYTLTTSGSSESFAHDPVEQFGGSTEYFVDRLRSGEAPEPQR
ncbi:hypothetical protein QJS66_12835 [Kocuria rhizophila]|nr:hypothetical protein QJS66_12835 [Kocuria rhizophila]